MLTIHLNTKSELPLYEQIYRYIKEEIRNGSLPYHSKLPSTRSLAAHLLVSRNTIDMAYAQLLSEGYIESSAKRGYFICQITDLVTLNEKKSAPYNEEAEHRTDYTYHFSPFSIDINHFPYNTWRKLSKDCMNNHSNDLFLLGSKQGDSSFRASIQKYLHESRGVICQKEQIIIGAGADYLLQLLAQLLKPSNLIAMENPTYKQAYRIFHGFGHRTCSIPLDQNGIRVDYLSSSEADIAYVTPSHQYPLGIVMPIKRRMELLHWANKRNGRYIIEDDHDSEFRYKGKPIPALQGLDTNGKVIYMGTFSRAIAPAIRVGYLVLPNDLLIRYRDHYNYYNSTVSRIDQAILTTFINDGYFERHLNKVRKIYRNKHDVLLNALKIFGDRITIQGEHAGLHLVVQFHLGISEEDIIDRAARNGIKLYGLKEHYISFEEEHYIPTILLGYANLTEEDIQTGTKKLYEALTM